jgi:hypothetical protein
MNCFKPNLLNFNYLKILFIHFYFINWRNHFIIQNFQNHYFIFLLINNQFVIFYFFMIDF